MQSVLSSCLQTLDKDVSGLDNRPPEWSEEPEPGVVASPPVVRAKFRDAAPAGLPVPDLSHDLTGPPIAYTLADSPAPVEAVESLIRTRKYLPVAHLLLSNSSDTEVNVSFAELEHLIGEVLPKSAHVHRAWWANDQTHVQASAWLSVGWRVAAVDLAKATAKFERVQGSGRS